MLQSRGISPFQQCEPMTRNIYQNVLDLKRSMWFSEDAAEINQIFVLRYMYIVTISVLKMFLRWINEKVKFSLLV